MQKIALITSVPFLLFGFELNFSKEFSKSVKSNELASSISINVDDKEEKQVISKLDKYNKLLKKETNVEKSNISISINPKYLYKDGTSTLEGYNGSLNYTISSKNSEEIKDFLEEFYSQKKESGVSLLVPNLKWQVSSKVYTQAIEDLNLEAILWSEKYSQELSNKISKKCIIKKISLNEIRPRAYYSNIESHNLKMSNDSLSMPITERVNQDIKIDATLVLECK